MHCDNADKIAAALMSHPKILAVHYPGLPDHPGHELATKQMSRYGAMMSIIVEGSAEAASTLRSAVAYLPWQQAWEESNRFFPTPRRCPIWGCQKTRDRREAFLQPCFA